MTQAVQLWVQVEGLSTRQDNSVKIVLSSQELNPDDAAKLFGLRGKQLYAALIETDYEHPVKLSDIHLPEEEPEFPRAKTPSERLRNVLWVLWGQRGKPGEFEAFRAARMEQIIEQIKQELEP